MYCVSGKYNVKLRVTDSNGCSDSMINAINIFITPTVDAGNDTLVCAGSKITLNPTGAVSLYLAK
jgi:PKD repeat protein